MWIHFEWAHDCYTVHTHIHTDDLLAATTSCCVTYTTLQWLAENWEYYDVVAL